MFRDGEFPCGDGWSAINALGSVETVSQDAVQAGELPNDSDESRSTSVDATLVLEAAMVDEVIQSKPPQTE